VPVLINALKEQQSEIEILKEQESKLANQQLEIDELKELVKQLASDK
jgi:Tfp pilus assembly protein PilN